MAVSSAALETYDSKTIREDLTDAENMISPTETPFISSIAGKATATNTKHEWPVDELGAVDDPRFFIALNRLVDLEEQVKTQKVAQKVKQVAEIKPAAKIKGKAGNVKPGLHDGLSTAEWIRRDQARSAQRR